MSDWIRADKNAPRRPNNHNIYIGYLFLQNLYHIHYSLFHVIANNPQVIMASSAAYKFKITLITCYNY